MPWNGDHDSDTVPCRKVHKPARWGMVNANNVYPHFTHQLKITLRFRLKREMRVPLSARTERSVGSTLKEKLSFSLKEKFCSHL